MTTPSPGDSAQAVSPLPWKPAHPREIVDAKGATVAIISGMKPVGTARNDAAFIVRAVNAHQAMVDALERALRFIQTCVDEEAIDDGAADEINAALSAAKGGAR